MPHGAPVATPSGPGASDRPTYRKARIVCCGLNPYLIEIKQDRYMAHGNDERQSVENLG